MYTFNAIEKQKSFEVMELDDLSTVLPMTKFIRGTDPDSRSRNLKFSIEYDENGVMYLYFDNEGGKYEIRKGDHVVRLHDGSFQVFSEEDFDARFQTRV